MPVYTLFGQPASPVGLTIDSSGYTMGVQFSSSQPGTITAIWFFSPPGAVSLPNQIGLFQVTGPGTGTLVASQAPSWSGAAGSGWVRAPFTTPPAISAGSNYKACILDNAGSNFYGATANYWATSGVTSGPLTAPNNAGGDGGQDTFTSPSPGLLYPATSFNASNYWVDLELTTTAAGPVMVPGGDYE